MGLMPLDDEEMWESFFPLLFAIWGHSKKNVIYKPRWRPSSVTKSIYDLRLYSLQNYEKHMFVV